MAYLSQEGVVESEILHPRNADEEILGHPSIRAHLIDIFRRRLLAKIGLVIVALSLVLLLIGPIIVPHDVTAATNAVNLPPSPGYWFGTDPSGLDVFSRVIAAPRIDLSIAIIATVLSFTAGSAIGLFGSFFGGRIGESIMRGADTVQAFPVFVLAIIVVVLTGRAIQNIVLVIGILNAPIYLRLMRSQVLSLRERSFVEAARASGATEFSIAWRQVLPNAIAPCLAQTSMTIGWSILVTTGLSFVGAGVLPPAAEWGSMISAGANGIIIGQWWPSVFPGIAMSLTVFGFAAVGDAVQSAFLREG